ncbi:hypothetical protein K0F10_17430 [Bacteroides fragilis]|nr:hypothetical protein [Bacteroides hominis (ex Liu et al. 2022)]MCE8626549.1 hypothetical protein [Bacteroides fragilis]MCE8706206.1 hypothetical protein [Bacteroides fragilis]MCS2391564.1 hypothetical protein [Bacteroides fragilis]MCY6336672.1 hypothetical protein [Bacteroides fragilis]MDV6148467.1 hypothetical protein [Bacteroides hominis (ex Liu et al. 2022)]
MAVSAYMYFLFYRVDREHRNTKTDFWTPTAGLWGSETWAFRVEAPCFSQKEVSIFRKCLLLSGEMLTSFSEKQRSFVSHLLLPVFRSGVNLYISLVASEWRTLRKR